MFDTTDQAMKRGKGRREHTHLASASVASKRFAGATTANAGVGLVSTPTRRALGATHSVRVSAMHIVVEGLRFGSNTGVGSCVCVSGMASAAEDGSE